MVSTSISNSTNALSYSSLTLLKTLQTAGISVPQATATASLTDLANTYAQNYQNDQLLYQQSTKAIHAAAQSLQSAAENLTTGNLSSRKVTSDMAAVSGMAKPSATVTSYEVSVSQLAARQRNEGTSFLANTSGILAKGNYTLGIQIGNKSEVAVNISVKATDTAKQVMIKVASAVNAAKLGITAGITQNQNGKQSLQISSQETGASQNFTIRDINGNAVSSLGLSHTVQNAADAKYIVNGKASSATSNQIVLDKGKVTLDLKAVTKGNVKVQVANSSEDASKKVHDLVQNYNATLDALNNTELTRQGQKLTNDLKSSIWQSKPRELATVGITMNAQTGKLNFDSKKFAKALEADSNKVTSLLTNTSGVTASLDKVATSAVQNKSTSYVKSPNLANNLEAYNSQAKMISFQTLLGGNYSQLSSFLNMMI